MLRVVQRNYKERCTKLVLSTIQHTIPSADNGLNECWHNAALVCCAFSPAIWQHFKQSAAKPPKQGSPAWHLLQWMRGFDEALALSADKSERAAAKRLFNAVRGADAALRAH